MEQDNRESWLNRVAIGMAPLFDALDTPLPARVRVAIGFTSRGAKGKAIGECWDNRRSGDGHFEIFIRPDLAHAPHPCPARHRWRDHGTQEAGDGDAQMRVRGVRLYGEDRAQMAGDDGRAPMSDRRTWADAARSARSRRRSRR